MRNWIRVLKVKLIQSIENGKGREMVFGDNFPDYDMKIDVTINKYMSALKDNATITIANLTYAQVIQIVNGKYYGVEIIAGYRDGNQTCVFKGAVLRISNTLNDDRTNDIIILCGSNLMARFSQRFLNFSLQSGMNTYSAIKFLSARAGIKNSNISTQFKKDFLQQVATETKTIGSYLDSLATNNPNIVISADETTGATFSIFDASKSNNRVINLRDVQYTGGYPRLDSTGLSFSILPTFAFQCGDVVMIDNSLISLEAVSSIGEMETQSGYYLDKQGAYMITSITYRLANRGSQFGCNITAKARSLISNYIGVV